MHFSFSTKRSAYIAHIALAVVLALTSNPHHTAHLIGPCNRRRPLLLEPKLIIVHVSGIKLCGRRIAV
jgi:hypothetical protein